MDNATPGAQAIANGSGWMKQTEFLVSGAFRKILQIIENKSYVAVP